MPTITDAEFGELVVRTHQKASRISLRVAPDGRLRASTPPFTPLIAVKLLLKTSRPAIRKLLAERQAEKTYDRDQTIGKSHALVIQRPAATTRVQLVGTKIMVQLIANENITDTAIQRDIRQIILKVLRKEAKSYLPRRLKFLAETHGFHYQTVKLTHASSRWGSCSSRGTISLNISLMQLPFALLDYVLIHELCHTRQMNHSEKFWCEVAAIDPHYKLHRREIKQHTPNI